MKKSWNKAVLFVLCLLPLFIFSNCLGSPASRTPSGERILTGQLGAGFTTASITDGARGSGGALTGIASFKVMTSALTLQETIPVEEDGSFEVSMEVED